MPTYNYICLKCKHEWEETKKISNMNEPLGLPCPNCAEHKPGNIEKRIYHAPGFGDPVKLGFQKPDNNFKDVLRRIHERTPGSQLDQTSTITKL
jgi:putative FmdB family regulatory protein